MSNRLFVGAVGALALTCCLLLAGCDERSKTRKAEVPHVSAKVPDEPALVDAAAKANKQIIARQAAVKAWSQVKVPALEAAACPQAPKVRSTVNGFKTGLQQARKTMSLLSAGEVEGEGDPSLSADMAEAMRSTRRAERSAPAPWGWATVDYTTEEYPFKAGPRAEAFQYIFAEAALDSKYSLLEKGLAELQGDELVLIAQSRLRTEVSDKTFTGGAILGVALLWSYAQNRFICAGRFEAAITSEKFTGSKGQIEALPEQEVELHAFENAIAGLRQLKLN